MNQTGSNQPQGTSSKTPDANTPAPDPQTNWFSTTIHLLRQARQFANERFATNTHEFLTARQPLVWLLALATGILVALAAIGFRVLIGLIQYPWLGTMSESVATAAAQAPWWLVLLTPAAGGLFVGLILERFVTARRAHNVADVIESASVKNCRIDTRTGLISAALSTVSIGTGASVGREGPIVHLGATIAAFVIDRFKLPPSAQRTLIACGAAAAVSASFNAPIAGVLFAHEIILTHYALRAFVPTVIASVAGAVISRLYFGNFPAFIIPNYAITSYWEFPAFALLGITCAIVAIVFQLLIMATEHLSWRLTMPLWMRASLGGLLIGAIGLAFPQALGLGYETTDDALSQQLPLALLLALIVAKTAATAISFASRLAGGIFSPSLYLGAMTGAAFGLIATSLVPNLGSSHGLYAILGMGAVSGAVLGAPLSTILIMFELTGGYEMTIALMLTVSIAVGLSQAYLGRSYFHWQLAKRGLFLHQGPHNSITRRIFVSEFMILLEPSKSEDEEEGQELRIEDDSQPWLTQSDTLEKALRSFDRAGITRIPVVSPTDPTLIIGWADRIAALNTFNKALIDAHVEAHR